MFTPANNNVVAPVTTPIFKGWDAAVTITEICGEFRATDPNTIATLGSLILCLVTAANLPDGNDDALRANCRKLFRGNCYVNMMTLITLSGADPLTDNDHNINAMVSNTASCANWLADLINAAKKKTLTDENVEGYFAMLGHSGTKPSVIARFINQLAPFFPDMVGNDGFRALLAPGVWTTYRNTRVSTGLILRELLPDFRALRIMVAGDTCDAAIIASANAPWDISLANNIPEKVKAYGCIFLQVAGTPIDSWYQGNKAVDSLSAAKVRGAKAIFRKYLDVKNTVDVESFTEVANFTASDTVRDFFA